MTKFLLLLLSILALGQPVAHAQIHRGTGLLAHNHGPVLFYTYASRLAVQPAHRDEFLRATRALAAQARTEADCQRFDCYEDAEVPNTFLLNGSWRTSPALQAHLIQPYRMAYFEQLPRWLVAPARLVFYETVQERATSLVARP